MQRFIAKGSLFAALFALAACQQNVPPPAAHAKSYVFKAKDDFDPNFTTRIADSIKMMTPVFAQFYDEGKKDRAAGATRDQALRKAEGFKTDPAFNNISSQEQFVNQTTTTTLGKKKQQVFIQEAMGAYLDGFDGR